MPDNFQRRHRAVPAPEGCGSIYTTHDTDQGIQRSKTHFPASPLDLTRKGVIFAAMGAPSKIPHNDYSEQWRRYKKFKKLRLFYLLGWIPVIAVYIMLIRIFGDFTLVFLAPYVLLGYAAGIGESIWPCPRCGQFFSKPSQFCLEVGTAWLERAFTVDCPSLLPMIAGSCHSVPNAGPLCQSGFARSAVPL
jgi:hypothetical protein